MIDISNGIRPNGVVNPEVFDRPSFQKKWNNLIVNKVKQFHNNIYILIMQFGDVESLNK